MALNIMKLPKLFGRDAAAQAEAADQPTTQVRAGNASTGYDPLATVSIMDQLRTAVGDTRMPKKLWLISHCRWSSSSSGSAS